MLMLQRAAENVNPSECNDPAVLLACSLGSDSCPAACQKDSEKNNEDETAQGSTIDGMAIAGDLNIAVADYSDTVKSAPAVGTVIFNAVDFKASEKVTIESVKLERTGLSSKSAIRWVWFEKDGMAVSAKASLTSDWTATTRFYNGYSVSSSDTLDLVVELSGDAGSEIAFKFVDVTSTAKNASFNTQTSTYRTTKYEVASVSFKINWGAGETSYKLGEKNSYEIGKFQISNENAASEDKDVEIKAIKLKNDGKLDLASTFKNVQVYRDNKVVSKSVELNSKDLTIYFNDEVLASWKKGIYTIYAEVANLESTDDTVKLYLNKSSEIVADEMKMNFRANVKDETAGTTEWTLKSYLFKWGKVNFTNDSSMAKTVEAAPSSTDVVIAKGTLTVAEPIKLETLVITGTLADTSVNPIKTLKIEIGGSTYSAENPSAVAGTNKVVWKFTDEIYVSKTSDVRVLANIISSNSDIKTKTITFDSLKGLSFAKWTYENNDEKFVPTNIIAWSIQISKVVPTAGKFYLTNKASSSSVKVVAGDSKEVTLFDWEITSNKDRVSVTDLILSWAYKRDNDTYKYGLAAWEQISLTLYVNGESYSDAIYSNTLGNSEVKTDAKFSNIGDVSSGNPLKIKVTAQPSVVATGSITFKIAAKWTDSEGNDAIATEISTSKLEITEGASITVANATSSSTVEKDGSEATLATFTSTVKNGSYELNSLEVAVSGANANYLTWKTVYVEFDWKRVSTSAPDDIEAITGGVITFTNIAETLEEGKHEFKLLTDINTDEATTGVALTVKSVKLDSKSQNLNASKLFVKAYPTISLTKKDSDNNEITLKITNPESSTEDLIISKVILSTSATAVLDTISLNDQTISANADIEDWKQVTLAPGQSTELRWSVRDAGGTNWNSAVSLTGIVVKVSWESDVYTISDTYTNVAKWSDLKITYKK